MIKIIDTIQSYNYQKSTKDFFFLRDKLISLSEKLDHFFWLERESIIDLDYHTTVPKMGQLVDSINEFNIVNKSHDWNYSKLRNESNLQEMIDLVDNFTYFIDNQII